MIDALMVAIANLILTILFLYKWVIIVSSLLSWVQPDPNNSVVQMLYRLTEPAYNFIRRFIPTVFGGIDLAPLILIFAIMFIEIFLGNLFHSIV
jgi:YggT family protein